MHDCLEGLVDLTRRRRVHDDDSLANGLGSGLHRCDLRGTGNAVRIDDKCNQLGFGNKFAQQLQPFRAEFIGKDGDASRIATRLVHTGNEAQPDWVNAHAEDDGNG